MNLHLDSLNFIENCKRVPCYDDLYKRFKIPCANQIVLILYNIIGEV